MSDTRDSFQKSLKNIAHDMVIIWNDRLDRWQICQVSRGNLLMAGGKYQRNLSLLFTVQHDNGDYRHPDNRDLMRCITIVQQSHVLWGMNESQVNKLADDLDAHDTLKAEEFTQAQEARFEEAAIDIFNRMHGRKTFI